MEQNLILVINPGSTSTKIAIYRETTPIFLRNINHSLSELEKFSRVAQQYEYRIKIIKAELVHADIEMESICIVIGRGGLIKPVESGVYEVNDAMKKDLRDTSLGEHASDLGGLIADEIAKSLPNAKAYIADPVVVDELEPIARLAGHPAFSRKSIFHALNQKAIGRLHAETVLKKYEEMNLIIAHLGGGITIGAHQNGRVIDVNQGLDGEGPFSPERSGNLPMGDLVNLCFSKKYTEEEIRKMLVGEGGLVAYLNTNNAADVAKKIQTNDPKALLIYNAMAYQVAKWIGAMYTVLKCQVDAILITGGIANDKYFVNQIIERVYKIAPIHIYPGEDEMRALANNAIKVLKGEIKPKIYN